MPPATKSADGNAVPIEPQSGKPIPLQLLFARLLGEIDGAVQDAVADTSRPNAVAGSPEPGGHSTQPTVESPGWYSSCETAALPGALPGVGLRDAGASGKWKARLFAKSIPPGVTTEYWKTDSNSTPLPIETPGKKTAAEPDVADIEDLSSALAKQQNSPLPPLNSEQTEPPPISRRTGSGVRSASTVLADDADLGKGDRPTIRVATVNFRHEVTERPLQRPARGPITNSLGAAKQELRGLQQSTIAAPPGPPIIPAAISPSGVLQSRLKPGSSRKPNVREVAPEESTAGNIGLPLTPTFAGSEKQLKPIAEKTLRAESSSATPNRVPPHQEVGADMVTKPVFRATAECTDSTPKEVVESPPPDGGQECNPTAFRRIASGVMETGELAFAVRVSPILREGSTVDESAARPSSRQSGKAPQRNLPGDHGVQFRESLTSAPTERKDPTGDSRHELRIGPGPKTAATRGTDQAPTSYQRIPQPTPATTTISASIATTTTTTRQPAVPPSVNVQATARTEPLKERPAGPLREIRLEMTGDEGRVEVKLTERAGELKVAVRTPDTRLADRLRTDLPVLSARLEDRGLRAETWHPAEVPAASLRDAQQVNTTDNGGQHEGSKGHGQQNEEHSGDRRPPHVRDENEQSKEQEKDFEWFLSTTR